MVVNDLADEQLTNLVAAVVAKVALEPKPERLAFNLAEASQVTGVSEKQLRLAIARKELKGRRIGKGYRITRESLLAWIDQP